MTTAVTHAIAESDLQPRFGPPHPRAVNKVKSALDEWMTGFIQRSPFMVVGTATSDGECDVSPKGGAPGFVAILDPRTLLIPDYAGNNLFFGHRNLLDNPKVALLFLIPGEGYTVRVVGEAQIVDDEESLQVLRASSGELPRLGIRVAIQECFSHCPKALTRSDLWNPARHTRFPKPVLAAATT